MSIQLFTDGGAKGNPGPAGIGAVIFKNKKIIKKYSQYIGEATNNIAEYKALILGLEKLKQMGIKDVECFADSELLVKQINREYKVKNPELQKFFIKVWNLSQSFRKITFNHVPREKNKQADKLVKIAIKNFKLFPIKR